MQIVHHDFYSKYIPCLDPVRGNFRLLSLEELRGNSLKKKKPKKEENSEDVYQILLGKGEEEIMIEECGGEMGEEAHEGQMKKFPLFSDICIRNSAGKNFVYLSTFTGTLI